MTGKHHPDLWSAILVLGGGVLATVLLTSELQRDRAREQVRVTEAAAEVLAGLIENHTQRASEDLNEFAASYDPTDPEAWSTRATRLLATPGFVAVGWVPPEGGEMVIRGSEALAVEFGELLAPSPEVEPPASPRESPQALLREQLLEGADGDVILRAEGGRGLGTVLARYSPALLMEALVGSRAEAFHLAVDRGDESLYRRGELNDEQVVELELDARVGRGVPWRLSVWPIEHPVGSILPEVVLLLGLAVSVLFASTVGLAKLASKRTVELEELNEALTASEREAREAEGEVRELTHELEARVEARTAELRSAVHDLETFNYSVSHDLRSPLGAILNFASLLREDYGEALGEEGRGYLARIERNGREVVAMMDDLLALSRVGRKELAPIALDTAAIVRESWTAVTSEEERKRTSFAVGELPGVLADPDLVELTLRNMLENAMELARDADGEPRIEVGGERRADDVVLHVHDNGPGFEIADGAQLFQIFEKVGHGKGRESSRSRLPVVARVAQRHGGRAWVESSPGAGTTLYISLPAA